MPVSPEPPVVETKADPEHDEQPRLTEERFSSSRPPAPPSDDDTSSLIDASGPPSTRYRLIAPRSGRRLSRG